MPSSGARQEPIQRLACYVLGVDKSREHPSDQELVHRALAERDAFAPIVARYDGVLRRYITRLGSFDSDTAKDILQETFIKAYIHLNDYDPALPFGAWLYRIAHNEAISHFRKQKNRPRPMERVEDLELFERIADTLDIAQEADRKIDQSTVRAALSTLDFTYRELIILRFFEEKSYEEIADILELPVGTVAAYLNRAKAKLRAALKGYDEPT